MIRVSWRGTESDDLSHEGVLLGFVYKEKHFQTVAIISVRDTGRIIEKEISDLRCFVGDTQQ